MKISGHILIVLGLMLAAGYSLGKLHAGLVVTILGSAAVLVLYGFWIAYLHGMFLTFTAHDSELQPFTYYYKECQAYYYTVEAEFRDCMSSADITLLRTKLNIHCMSLYFDYPNMLQDAATCRSCIGLAIWGWPDDDVLNVVKRLNLEKKRVFDKVCKTVQSSFLPVVSNLSYLISGKLLLPLWNKLRENHNTIARSLDIENIPFYMIENDHKIAYGFMVGDERKQYSITTKPQPKLNELGENSRKIRITDKKWD